MSYDDDHEEYALQAAVEGNGYHKSKGLQWLDLCPHLGTSEKTLLRVLLSLTRQENPRRKIAPEELRHLVYAGPVALGEEPKYASVSGLRRMLRALAVLGQITTPEDTPITFSSGQAAQKRAVTMQIWRYPRHECASRNAFDALARHRGEKGEKGPRFPLACPDMAPRWQHLPMPETKPSTDDTPSDQAGQKDDQAGQKDDQAGQKDDQAGQKDDQRSRADQEKGAPPRTAPDTAPCIPPSPLVPPQGGDTDGPGGDTTGREEESSNNTNNEPAGGTTPEPPQAPDDHQAHLDHAQVLVDRAVRLWPTGHRAPSPRDRQRLCERVVAELAAGGDETVIVYELSRDLQDAGSAIKVIMGSRTKIAGWGQAHDPRPAHSRHEIQTRTPWCGSNVCDERTRLTNTYNSATGETRPARCRTPIQDPITGETVACHPKATPRPPAPSPESEEDQEPTIEELDPEILQQMQADLEASKARKEKELAATKALFEQMRAGAAKEEAARGSRR